ncbi:phage protein [[Actinobacillus] muris]|uniref:Phage protein n=1 Tax=Muribacter muris TaxID=67855 RepID=A0A0J5P363_9PAST|nr:DUF1364 domain-containing protein [Muribacter muris]KMK50923.1 phage protein [[Actinobacillus] muris] [Muribacter muris]
MTNLRKEAKGRECQVRLPGICNFNPETTVLAHIRMAGITGARQKSSDILGAWACSACHNEIDRRTRHCDLDEVKQAHADGVFRTIANLVNEGKVKW